MYTDIQRREIFHFCFLERLLKQSTDPALYVLKGGVNLRFFFNSPRYSEDMDLDVAGGSVATLKKNGYKILEDAAFARSLRTYGIESIEINAPERAKHTQTTQRFRLGLMTTAGLRLPTTVEFSRRTQPPDTAVAELIEPMLARQYHKLSFRCRHYPGQVAAQQKVMALAGRTQTQARDVFDLYLLHTGGYAAGELLATQLPRDNRQAAIAATLSLTFDDFCGQVVEFLQEPSKQEWGTASSWQHMQETLLKVLDDA